MTAFALSPGERVHIIAYNDDEWVIEHIAELLENAEVDMNQVDFTVCPTDDFLGTADERSTFSHKDDDGQWVILDWVDGTSTAGVVSETTPFALDDAVPLAAKT